MDANKHSELDKLFRSKITGQEKSEWNTPPKQVLFEALAQIEEKDDHKKGLFLYIGIIAFLLAAVVGIGFFNNNKIEKLNQKIDQVIVEKNKINANLKNNNKAPIIASPKQAEPTIASSVKEVNSSAQKNTTSEASKNELSKNISFGTSTNNIIPRIIEPTTIHNEASFGDNKSIIAFSTKKTQSFNIAKQANPPLSLIKDIPFLNALQTNDFNIEKRAPLVSNLNTVLIKDPIVAAKNMQSIFLISGANFSNFSMSALNPLSANLTSYDNFYLGYQVGLGTYLPLNKRLSFKPSLAYNKIRNKSIHNTEMLYDKNAETLNADGSFSYNSMIDMESPLGVYSRSISMDHSDAISNGAMLQNETHILNSFDILQFNAALDYKILDSKKISLSGFGGLGVNFVMGMNQSMKHHTYHNNNLIYNHEFISTETNALNSIYYSAQLGLSLRYKLCDHAFIGFETVYMPSLASVRKVDPSTQVKTKINQFNGNLLIGFNF